MLNQNLIGVERICLLFDIQQTLKYYILWYVEGKRRYYKKGFEILAFDKECTKLNGAFNQTIYVSEQIYLANKRENSAKKLSLIEVCPIQNIEDQNEDTYYSDPFYKNKVYTNVVVNLFIFTVWHNSFQNSNGTQNFLFFASHFGPSVAFTLWYCAAKCLKLIARHF